MKKIFIVHGWAYSTDIWEKCLEAFRKRGFEPIMFKVPGLTSPSSDVWDVDSYVEWLRTSLEKENENEKEKDIVLMGHSNGGRISIAYAAKYPGRISRLILLDAAGILHNEWHLRLKRNVFGRIARVGKKIIPLPSMRKLYYRLVGAYDYERAPENMRKTMNNLITRDLTPELSKVKEKTLILWGAHDKSTPVSDAHIMHKRIAGSELFIFKDARHSPYITHPEEVAEKTAEWLNKNA